MADDAESSPFVVVALAELVDPLLDNGRVEEKANDREEADEPCSPEGSDDFDGDVLVVGRDAAQPGVAVADREIPSEERNGVSFTAGAGVGSGGDDGIRMLSDPPPQVIDVDLGALYAHGFHSLVPENGAERRALCWRLSCCDY